MLRSRRYIVSSLSPLTLLLLLSMAPPLADAQERTLHGFDTARLALLDSVLHRYVGEGRVAGAVGLVLRDGNVVYQGAAGWMDAEAGRPMTPDAIFRIASQSKAVTSAAIMMLVEQGRINLNEPVSRWIPTFANSRVAVRTEDRVDFVPARRPITIRDLLTHTAGVSYGGEATISAQYIASNLGSATGYGWYTADKDEPICDTMERLGTLPIVQHPGVAWVYGYNTDILGCVVERVSGLSLDEFLRTRLTGPLGMRDTHFYLPPQDRDRFTAVYTIEAGTGRAVRAPDGPRGQGEYVEGPRRSFAGGAGMLSTARDYARFLEMLRNGGALDGVRYLSPASVALMTTNQIGTLRGTDGLGFGLGFETVDRVGAGNFASVGSFGWSGAYGTFYRVDPLQRLVIVLMLQVVPYFGSGIRESFEAAVYGALVEPL